MEYTDYLIQKIAATGEEHALEVAAGTCICGRALAPYVKDITCLDMTEEMLAQGIRLAEESHIENIYFQSGNAEKLPYEPETFDLVITRLSFHHFDNPEKPFEEMKRVLKKGERWWSGIWKLPRSLYEKLMIRLKICVILLIPESSAGEEFEEMFKKDFALQCEETTLVPVNLKSWMELTDTSEDVQEEITNLMKAELEGGRKTGFFTI